MIMKTNKTFYSAPECREFPLLEIGALMSASTEDTWTVEEEDEF